MSRESGGPWAPLAWMLAGAAVCGGMIPLEPNLVEEGFALHVAERIAHGEQLYRDIIFFSGPLPFELLGLLFRIFGESVWAARGTVLVLHALASGASYAAARTAGAGPYAHVAGATLAASPVLLFPLFSIYFHTTLATYFVLLAIWAATGAPTSRRRAVATGVLVACAAISKQSVGGILAVTLSAAIVASAPTGTRRARLLDLVLGGVVVAALTLLLFAVRGNLEPLFRCVVLLPFSLGESFYTPYMNLWPPGQLGERIIGNYFFYMPKLQRLLGDAMGLPSRAVVVATQILFALPWLTLAVTFARGVAGTLPRAAWIYGAGLAALLVNLYPRADWGHLVPVLPATAVQLAILVGTPGATASRRIPVAISAGLMLAATLAGGALIQRSTEPTLGPRVPLRPVGDDAQTIVPAVDYLLANTEPGDAIFVARAEPLIYWATRTRNPTAYEGILHLLREDQQSQIIEGLEQVRYAVMSDVDHPFTAIYARELPRVHDHLERHFDVPRDWRGHLSPVQVLERIDPRPPTLIDLVPRWSRGAQWVRDREGTIAPLATEAIPNFATRLNRRPMGVMVGPGGGGIDLVVELPEGAVFESSLGLRGVMSPLGLHVHPRGVTLRVSVDEGAGFEEAGSARVGGAAGRRWESMRVDLSEYGGQTVRLRLDVSPDRARDGVSFAWWGSPRITLHAAEPADEAS